jgi:GT2 family glycosyltransferase
MSQCVFIIILNTNRREDTLECLSSIIKSTYDNQNIIILDNASTDGSVEAIRKTYPQVQILSLDNNRGYAGNNNVGIRAALAQGADWVFLLNEDTIMAPDCLSNMIKTGESQPEIGIIGPLVYHYDEPNVIQSAGGILDARWFSTHLGQNELDQGQFMNPRSVDWVTGCAILVRRPVIDQVGMLDERFFYYSEEAEWCLRARKNGWSIIHVPKAKLWHKGVQRNYHPAPSITYYQTRNHFLMLWKHKAPLFAWFSAWYRVGWTLTSWTIKPKWRLMREHRDAMFRGILDFIGKRWYKYRCG